MEIPKTLDTLKNTLRELWKKNPFRIAVIIVAIIVLGLGYFLASTPVKVGTRVVCRYGHMISDNTRTIRVPWFLADRFKVDEDRSVCSRHERAEKLYAKAQRQIVEKKLPEAKKTLDEVTKLDSDFKKTESQAAAISQITSSDNGGSGGESGDSNGSGGDTGNSNGSGGSDSGAGGGGTNSGGGSSNGGGQSQVPIDLPALLPQGDIPGYTRGALLTNEKSAQLDYKPTLETSTRIRSLLLTVRLMDNSDAVNNFIENTSKKAFPNDSKNPSVKGSTAYFGTNIYGYANLEWPYSVIVYEISMFSAKATPFDLYDDIVKTADYFP